MPHAAEISVSPAGERLFRAYHRHCTEPDSDTLFALLNGVHSFNDKLEKATGQHFFERDEFIALKALRNLFHHEEELAHNIRTIAADGVPNIISDLLYLCLVPSALVDRAIDQVVKKHRHSEEPRIRSALKWYGSVVNINPCILNFMVHAFEMLSLLGIEMTGAEHEEFAASYAFEEQAGHSHFVTGDIACAAGSVEEVLAKVFANVT